MAAPFDHAWAPQAASYAAFDFLETSQRFGAVESHLTIILLSTATYAPIVLWYRDRRRAAEQRDAGGADEAGASDGASQLNPVFGVRAPRA
ncbi:MAG TPA: hypothetical protein VGL15_11215 [Vicinamibacteria bacterium]